MLAQAAFGIGGATIALGQAALLDSSRRRASIWTSVGVRVGSLAGPLFGAVLLADGHSASQVLLGVLLVVLVCGACVGVVSRVEESDSCPRSE